MRFGLHLPNSGALAAQSDLVDLARRAEQAGFDAVWVFDHLFNPVALGEGSQYPSGGRYYNQADMPYFEAMTTLSVIAGATSSIQLGTRVMIVVYRSPVLLAKQIGTLTALAGDRLVLGVGAGWMHEEFEAVGVPPEERFDRLDEHIALMRQAWAEGVSEFSGRFTSHVAAGFHPVPRQPVPILLGGSTDKALRRIAGWADGWALPTFPAGTSFAEALGDHLARLRRACDAEGRDLSTLRLVAGASIDAEDGDFEALATAGVHEVDLVLSEPSDLDLVRPQERLAALRARHG